MQSGYAVFGLETPLFVLLVLAGTEMMFRERDRGTGFPYSGLVFGLAGLTRPEAPMFIGIPMLFLGLRFFGRQNLLRGVVFAAPIAMPHALAAQLLRHVAAEHAERQDRQPRGTHGRGAALPRGVRGAHVAGAPARALRPLRGARRAPPRRALRGGPRARGGRLRAPRGRGLDAVLPLLEARSGRSASCSRASGRARLLEPLLAELSTRAADAPEGKAIALAAGAGVLALGCLVALGVFRAQRIERAQHRILDDEKRFWDSAAGGVANWFQEHGKPGEVAVGDIGYIERM